MPGILDQTYDQYVGSAGGDTDAHGDYIRAWGQLPENAGKILTSQLGVGGEGDYSVVNKQYGTNIMNQDQYLRTFLGDYTREIDPRSGLEFIQGNGRNLPSTSGTKESGIDQFMTGLTKLFLGSVVGGAAMGAVGGAGSSLGGNLAAEGALGAGGAGPFNAVGTLGAGGAGLSAAELAALQEMWATSGEGMFDAGGGDLDPNFEGDAGEEFGKNFNEAEFGKTSGAGGALDLAARLGMNGGTTALQRILNGGGGSQDYLSMAGPLLSLISGGIGLDASNKLRKTFGVGGTATAGTTPFDSSGNRTLANQQLTDLMKDPAQVAATDPAYKLRIQAAQRAAAPYGQNSGRMAVAAADASTDWLNQRMTALGGLSGAGFSPATGAQLGLQGSMGANELLSQALASIGFGVNSLTGGGTGTIPPALLQTLLLLSSNRPS